MYVMSNRSNVVGNKGCPSGIRWLALALLPLAGAAALSTPARTTAAVHGDYVEARTASVFAGACHYNGERVTEGRSAVLAWNITGGAFQGVDLSGTRVMAAVACDDNLAETAAARKAEFVVDAKTDAQASAAVDWVKSHCASQLGSVVGVRREPITFQQGSEVFHVAADKFAALSVRAMPNHECCSQPNLVWYQPLMPIDGRRVGYTESAEYDAARIGDGWQRSDENSAFYGHFQD